MMGTTLLCLSVEGGRGSTSASPGFQPHFMTKNQLYHTSSSAAIVQALQIILWCIDTVWESVDMEN